ADLESLSKEAAMSVLRRNVHKFNLEEDKEIPKEVLDELIITKKDFDEALKVVRPSAMREVLVETPDINWDDIGGIKEVKQELKEAVEWPLKFPQNFKRLGIRPPKGILLYGPPGTGKTLLAKAVAKESESNFIQIKGPSLLSMWVGKSEEGVRKIFERARQVSPCVIFFDEIDALAGKRGVMSSSTKVTENVLNQLLAEMDGIEDLNNVIVLGATNRPDILDPALMRPGRFDRIIYVSIPNKEERLDILKIHTKNMPIKNKERIIEDLSDKTEGYTGADLENLVREAGMIALRDDIETKEVTKNNFDKAMEKVLPSVSQSDEERYKQIEKKYLRSALSTLDYNNQKSYLA
ncbi:MAG: AAA family ATPase, partial [Candidatus Nanoarchaeia archaeon]|nr:AAA family ATPase [Candidatus Nanoarchaeia archaeon]